MLQEFKKLKTKSIVRRYKLSEKIPTEKSFIFHFNDKFTTEQKQIILELQQIYRNYFDIWRIENCKTFQEELENCMRMKNVLEETYNSLMINKETHIEMLNDQQNANYPDQVLIHEKIDYMNLRCREIESKMFDIIDRIEEVTRFFVSSIYYPLLCNVFKLMNTVSGDLSIEQALVFAYAFGNFIFPKDISLFQADYEKQNISWLLKNITLHPFFLLIERKYIRSSNTKYSSYEITLKIIDEIHSKEQCIFYLRAYELYMNFPFGLDYHHSLFLRNDQLVYYMLLFLFPKLDREECKNFNLFV